MPEIALFFSEIEEYLCVVSDCHLEQDEGPNASAIHVIIKNDLYQQQEVTNDEYNYFHFKNISISSSLLTYMEGKLNVDVLLIPKHFSTE